MDEHRSDLMQWLRGGSPLSRAVHVEARLRAVSGTDEDWRLVGNWTAADEASALEQLEGLDVPEEPSVLRTSLRAGGGWYRQVDWLCDAGTSPRPRALPPARVTALGALDVARAPAEADGQWLDVWPGSTKVTSMIGLATRSHTNQGVVVGATLACLRAARTEYAAPLLHAVAELEAWAALRAEVQPFYAHGHAVRFPEGAAARQRVLAALDDLEATVYGYGDIGLTFTRLAQVVLGEQGGEVARVAYRLGELSDRAVEVAVDGRVGPVPLAAVVREWIPTDRILHVLASDLERRLDQWGP